MALRAALQSDARKLAAALQTTGRELTEAAERLRFEASERLRALDDAFRPFQRDLIAWLTAARQEDLVAPRLKSLKAAEKWLQG